jgi:2,3-bisphosphoglycerate-independent phosphoglycerate mutase
MKYIILIGDGMADYPLEALDNMTPLQAAQTNSMDTIATRGKIGMVQTIPHGLPPGSDIANLSILGYSPRRYLTGRAVYEAASAGVILESTDIAFRCNLVTLKERNDTAFMEDYSAGHIATDAARKIIGKLNHRLGSDEIQFYPGVSYRHLMVWKGGSESLETTPPHDISGRDIFSYLPRGEGSDTICALMEEAKHILNETPLEKERVRNVQSSANAIWLWGQGKPINLPTFSEKFGLTGSVISAVDLIKGMGVTLGLTSVTVPGATGYLDTNYLGKAEFALKELHHKDFVFVHVEAPDEAAHTGDLKNKIRAIEDFDTKVVKKVLEGIKEFDEYKVLVLPDHRTPIVKKTHTAEPVPFAYFSSNTVSEGSQPLIEFNEETAEKSGLFVEQGSHLMDLFIKS